MKIQSIQFMRFFSALIIVILALSTLGVEPASASVKTKTNSTLSLSEQDIRSLILRDAPLSGVPALTWNTFIGGSGEDSTYAITTDSSGNIYVVGYSANGGWGNPIRPYYGSGQDAFVAKLNSSGELLWNTFLGGSGSDNGQAITIGPSGDIYVSGSSDTGWGTPRRPYLGSADYFVAKLTSSGILQWNTFLGSVDLDSGYSAIVVDNNENILITGASMASWGCLSPADPCTARPYSFSNDAFAAKLDSSGNLVWNTFLGGGGNDSGNGITMDSSGNAYVVGMSSASWGCSPVACTKRAYSASINDAFIAKLNSSGALSWNSFLGGSGWDGAYSIDIDGDGNLYFSGSSDTSWGNPVRAYFSGNDAFAGKLDSAGNLLWNTFLGGTGYEYSSFITVDTVGNVYLSGGSNASWGNPVRAYTPFGNDATIVKLDSSGNLLWNTFLGANGTDVGAGVSVDNNANIYLAGGSGASWGSPIQAYHGGGTDAFVVKLPANYGPYSGIFYVKPAASGTGNCQSWGNACTLQTALANTASGDEIWVAAGSGTETYKPTTVPSDRTATFQLKSGVAVYGGFAGTETTREERNPSTHVTILSGDIDNDDSQKPIITNLTSVTGNTTNSYHVVTGATGATLDGFTITAGNANGSGGCPGTSCGGGIINDHSSPIFINLSFTGNSAQYGGGLSNDYSSPSLTNVSFSNNTAYYVGGAMSNAYSNPTLTNVTFQNNLIADPNGGGGGIDNYYSDPTFTSVTFSSNAAHYGGGIHNYYSNPTFTNVIFSNNTAYLGGGIENEHSSPALTNITFSNNSASYGGGIENNTNSNPVLTNATFYKNSALYGGGMDNYSNSSPTFKNVTFNGNSANYSGGGISNYSSSLLIQNTILWGNTAQDGAQIANGTGSSAVVSDSIVQNGCPPGSNCTNIIASDPLLGTFGNYGGFTQTIPLRAGSSAIDAGNDATCATTDQRGVTRPQGAHCDIGAYEVQIGSFRSRASGPWNNPSTWEISTNGGTTWFPALDYPSAASGTIHIQNGHTVTLTESAPVDEVTIDTGGQMTINNDATLTVANGAGTDLAIYGTLLNQGTISISTGAVWTVGAGGTYVHNTTSAIMAPLDRATLDATSNFIYRGSSTLNTAVSLANRIYGNLSFESSSGTWSPSAASGFNDLIIHGNLSIGATGTGTVSYNMTNYTGQIIVDKDFQIGAGSALTTSTNNISIGGVWSNNGAFTPGESTVVFNGISLQTIGGSTSTTFNNLTVNNSSGILLGANAAVNNTLIFTSGKITTATNVLTIGPNGSVSGAGIGKYIYGNLRKTVATGNPSLTFEVGGTLNYAPVNVVFNNVSTGGTLTGSTTDGKHPNFDGADPTGSGLDGSNYINRYWTLTQSGLTFLNYDATFNFTAGDYIGSPNPGAMIVRKYDAPTWSHAATNTATATSATGTGFTSFSDFAVGNDTGSTPVTLSFFSTIREGDSTTFTWSTATESGNLGFNLYAEEDGRRQALNTELIPSQKIDSLEQLDYSYQATTTAKLFYIEEVDIHGETDLHGPFELSKTYGGRVDESKVAWAPVQNENRQKFSEQQDAAKQHMKLSATVLQAAVQGSSVASDMQLQNTISLKVNKTGIYRVSYEMLKAAGLDLAGVPASKITMTNRGEVVPVYVETKTQNQSPKFGPGDYFEFYGEALDTLYTDTNIYVVQTQSSAAPHIVSIQAAPGNVNKVPSSFQDMLVVNNQKAYADYAPGNDPWYDREMLVFTTPKSWDITFDVPSINPGTAAALDLTIWGVTDWQQLNDHHMQVRLNGSPLADETFDGLVEQKLHFELPAGLLREGKNTLTITLPGDTGVEAELIAFDKLSVAYQHTFTAQDGRLTFTASDKTYQVTNLPTKNVVVYRRDVKGIVRLGTIKVSANGNTFTATFAGTGEPATYFVSTVESLGAPVLEASKQIVDVDQPAQYLIIAHPNFIPSLQPLIQARRMQGLTVSVVNVNDLYTQYSYGIFDPSAIQKYIAYAVKNLGTQYVLLVGGDTYDYRNYLGINSVSFIPSLYTRTGNIANFVPSDPLYADVNADRIPDVAIGRFPVRTVAELDTLVAKTLAYASKDYGKTAVFASDKDDGALSFQAISNQFASTLPNDWHVTSIHLNMLSVGNARTKLIAAMNAGQALVTFTGHSDPQTWTFSNLFTLSDTKKLTNAGRPFIAVQWGCWNNYYVDPVYNYLVQGFLLNGDRGAAATLGATTLADANSEQLLGKLLTPRLAIPGMTLGDALQASKAELSQTHPEMLDVILGWSIMGDPALVVEP